MRTKDGADPLFSYDAIRLAANAGRDDVDVTLQVAPEGTHVFQLYFGALDEADEAIDEVARFFKRHLR
jgi:acetyl esterase/lipase